MLNFVYTLQAIVIFLTGIVSLLILAKLELSFVNFKSISNIINNFMVSFVNFSRSHDYENFPCCFHDKHGCYAMCCDCLKLELYTLQKNCRLD